MFMDWLQDDEVVKQAVDSKHVEPWKILVVDDDESVHQVTQLAMKRFEFEQRPIELHSVYSAAEAREKLQSSERYALILLDVVMHDLFAKTYKMYIAELFYAQVSQGLRQSAVLFAIMILMVIKRRANCKAKTLN